MNPPIRISLAIAVALLLVAIAVADDDAEDRAAEPIETWITCLGSDSFIERDYAGRQLLQRGVPAVAPLVRTVRGDDETAAATAITLLKRFALSDRIAAGTAAHRGLASLSTADEPLTDARRKLIVAALREADRHVAGLVSALGGRVERDSSLAIVGLQVNDQRFTDKQAVLLPRLSQITRLDLRDTNVTDRAIDALLTLTRLEELNLSDTSITADGLQRLAPLQSLTKLTIYRLPMTPDELEQLQATFPDCDIRP